MARQEQFESERLASDRDLPPPRQLAHTLYFNRLHRDLDSMLCPLPQLDIARCLGRRTLGLVRMRGNSQGHARTQIVIEITVGGTGIEPVPQGSAQC
jgi:hypothetical protein